MSASGSPMPRSAEDSTEAHNLELRHAEADYSGEEEIRSLTEQAKREALQAADPAQTQPPLSGARPVPPKRLDPVMSSRPKTTDQAAYRRCPLLPPRKPVMPFRLLRPLPLSPSRNRLCRRINSFPAHPNRRWEGFDLRRR